MRVVVALGGNALLKRGEPLAAQALAPLARQHQMSAATLGLRTTPAPKASEPWD